MNPRFLITAAVKLLLDSALLVGVSQTTTMRGRAEVGYCAFEVTVKSPKGMPVAGTPVWGMRQDGTKFADTSTDEKGIARVCDAPIGVVDIQVGGRRCGAVTIRYLKPYWMITRHVAVTYENCAGEEWAVPGGCLVTVRVRNSRGAAISGVRLVETPRRPPGRAQTDTSDQFGRIFRFLEYRSVLDGVLVKEHFLPTAISEKCDPGDDIEREVVVTLRRSVQ